MKYASFVVDMVSMERERQKAMEMLRMARLLRVRMKGMYLPEVLLEGRSDL